MVGRVSSPNTLAPTVPASEKPHDPCGEDSRPHAPKVMAAALIRLVLGAGRTLTAEEARAFILLRLSPLSGLSATITQTLAHGTSFGLRDRTAFLLRLCNFNSFPLSTLHVSLSLTLGLPASPLSPTIAPASPGKPGPSHFSFHHHDFLQSN